MLETPQKSPGNGESGKPTNGRSSIEAEVLRRYENGAREVEAALCCPVEYDARYLEAIPEEILQKDYGCGDPSRHVHAGERVLDLGSGAGKICYILSQKVGAEGSVIGVDFNDEMLKLARKYRGEMADKLGYGNVEFKKGRIQDLTVDLEAAQKRLGEQPIDSLERLSEFEAHLRRETPLVPDGSVDVVVSNCVLNLVRPEDKERLFGEIFRVLRRGGRAVISDIVCDEDPTETILADPKLWSACIAGAFREDRFLEMFEEAGFYGVEVLERQAEPWQVIDGVEFRSLTVRAYRGKQGPCLERNQAVVFKGPWRSVTDDDGHTYHRGQRMAVCDKTYKILTDPNGPYADAMIGVEPRDLIPLEEAGVFDCSADTVRSARATKGASYRENRAADPDCGPDCC